MQYNEIRIYLGVGKKAYQVEERRGHECEEMLNAYTITT